MPFAATNLDDVAKCVATILTTPSVFELTANKYIYIATHVCTQHTLLSVLEKVTGEPWKVERQHQKQVINKYKEKLLGGDLTAQLPLVKVAGWGTGGLGDFRDMEGGLWNEKVGLEEVRTSVEALETDVRRILASMNEEDS